MQVLKCITHAQGPYARYASGCLKFLMGGFKLLLKMYDEIDDTLDSAKEYFTADQARVQRQQLAIEVIIAESEDTLQRAAARLQHFRRHKGLGVARRIF